MSALLIFAASAPQRADASIQWMQTSFNTSGASLGGLSSGGGSVGVTLRGAVLGGGSLGTSAGAFLTQQLASANGPVQSSFLTFCVDLSPLDPPPPSYQAEVGVITVNPGPGSGSPEIRNVIGAAWLMNTVIAAGSLTASGSTYTSGLSGVNSRQLNAAAQLAIWEITFDNDTSGHSTAGSITGGNFYVTSSDSEFGNVTTITNRLVSAWVGAGRPTDSAGFVNYKRWVSGDTNQSQDQLGSVNGVRTISAVPEPSTIAMLISGILPLGLMGVRRAHAWRRASR